MLRAFSTAGRRAANAAHAKSIASPLASLHCALQLSLRITSRRGLFIQTSAPCARLVSGSTVVVQSANAARSGVRMAVSNQRERGFTRVSALLIRVRSAQTPPTVDTPAAALEDSPPGPANDDAFRIFLPPAGPATPLSWRDRGRFLLLESCTLVASMCAGSLVSQAAASAAPVLAPDMDAVVLLLSANAWMMPAASLTYLAILYARAKRGDSFTFLPLPRPPRGMTWGGWLFLAAVAIGFCTRQLGLTIAHPPVNERDIILEMSLDDQWLPLLDVGLIGPVSEEILFRGLFFARCAQFLGVGSGVMLSSLAFSLGHGSVAPSAMVMGMVFAGLYTTTGALLAPIALHAASNSSLLWQGRRFSPMTSLDAVADAFENKFAKLKQMGFLCHMSRAEATAMVTAVKLQSLPHVRQQSVSHAQCVFAALDRSGKGRLDASEVAWLMNLRPDEPRLLNAVVSVIERRVGGDENRLTDVQRNMDRMPSNIPLLDLPRARFIPDAHRFVLADQTAATAGSKPEQRRMSFQPLVQRFNARPMLTPIEPRVQAMQSELIQRYYSIQWNAFYRVHFPSGCDQATFENFFCRAFPLVADQRAVLWALQSDDEGTHPVAKLLQAHRVGRQSFGGVTRRLAWQQVDTRAGEAVREIPRSLRAHSA